MEGFSLFRRNGEEFKDYVHRVLSQDENVQFLIEKIWFLAGSYAPKSKDESLKQVYRYWTDPGYDGYTSKSLYNYIVWYAYNSLMISVMGLSIIREVDRIDTGRSIWLSAASNNKDKSVGGNLIVGLTNSSIDFFEEDMKATLRLRICVDGSISDDYYSTHDPSLFFKDFTPTVVFEFRNSSNGKVTTVTKTVPFTRVNKQFIAETIYMHG